MNIVPISNILTPEGLDVPAINALVPNEENYSVLLMQPKGKIEADNNGVRHKEQDIAQIQFRQFLENAYESGADLAISPEYSMPWLVLSDMIKSGKSPAKGKIWVLGCESIKYKDLDKLKGEISSSAKVLFESITPDDRKFLSPLAYVFKAPQLNENTGDKTIILVQFKTHPMGDPKHFEVNSMQTGTQVYELKNKNVHSLRLLSLICADAFALDDRLAGIIYDRSLIIHIQLNPAPRHSVFLGCRERLLKYKGDQTEILCLNWASNAHVWINETETKWKNISGSAWYLKSFDFDKDDPTLCKNHKLGLYYTWLYTHRTHALFFNYNPANYLLTATKVAHIGVAGSASIRRGPQLTKIFTWDNTEEKWIEQPSSDDGFSSQLSESGNAKHELKRITDENPIAVERILALCAGSIGNNDWYTVFNLDSCIIQASEIIRRITFCQDTDDQADKFRIARLKRCASLWEVLKNDTLLPPSLVDLKEGIRLEWCPSSPHQNIISNKGNKATAIYMGEDSSFNQIEAVAKKAAEYLNKSFSNPDDSHNARQRLAVWYRDNNGQTRQYARYNFVKFDAPGDKSEFDIGREK